MVDHHFRLIFPCVSLRTLRFWCIPTDGFWNRLRPRYYTIYDLANKRIGLALARQPVGQATVADVENGVNLRPILRP
jgi:hypothetical protein